MLSAEADEDEMEEGEEEAEEEEELTVKTTPGKYGHRRSTAGRTRQSPAPDFTSGDEEEEDVEVEVTQQEINSIIQEISVEEEQINEHVGDTVNQSDKESENLLTKDNVKSDRPKSEMQESGESRKRKSGVIDTKSSDENFDDLHRRRSKRNLRSVFSPKLYNKFTYPNALFI